MGRMQKCYVCNKLINIGSLPKHRKNEHPEFRYKLLETKNPHHYKYICDSCGQQLKSFEDLVLHQLESKGVCMNNQTELKTIESPICPICGKHVFVSPLMHLQTHHKLVKFEYNKEQHKTTYFCNICGKQVNSWKKLTFAHFKRNHSNLIQTTNGITVAPLEFSKTVNQGKKESIGTCENTNANKNGTSAKEIINAIEGLIIENRRLTLNCKDRENTSRLAVEGIKTERDQSLIRISELEKQLELCQIDKRRAEDALRRKILQEERPITLRISNEEEKQAIEERAY